MARVRKIKKNVAEVTLTDAAHEDKWGDDVDLLNGSTRVTAQSDGAYVSVTFLDGRPPQTHVLKAGATVTETPSGSVRIRGETHA